MTEVLGPQYETEPDIIESRQESKTSCCKIENDGVDNAGFETPGLSHCETHPQHKHSHKEEIGLEGMNYKQLCSCEEKGNSCDCRNKGVSNRSMIQNVSWGKWKCIALCVVIGLTLIWLAVFLSLHYTDVI